MTLDNFIKPKKPEISLKTVFNLMRAKWQKGLVSDFDKKLSEILDCSLDDAELVRQEWEKLGFVVYTKQGLLTWRGCF